MSRDSKSGFGMNPYAGLFDSKNTHLLGQFADLANQWANTAMRLAPGAGMPFGMGGDPLDPDRLEMLRETGLYLRDMRELTGMTMEELSEALDLKDSSLLEAAENGKTALPFELLLRMSALVARHDPIPFVMRMVRSHNPALWGLFDAWGLTRIPVQYAREREFVNIFRRHDEARKLSDEGWAEVLKFTRGAFEMALHFVASQEGMPIEKLQPEKPSTPADGIDTAEDDAESGKKSD
jgi:transcriptional regulator with XRE-family HTH domain